MNKLYLHKKTGNIYRELMRGELEANLAPVVIYQWVEGGTVWVRPAAEFDDGRFAPWDDETAPPADKPLIDRLKAAVEGECDDLAITDQQAKAILSYVLGDDDLSSLLIAAQEENSRLREALKPFAIENDEWCGLVSEDTFPLIKQSIDEEYDLARFTVGDFRRARAALGGSHE